MHSPDGRRGTLLPRGTYPCAGLDPSDGLHPPVHSHSAGNRPLTPSVTLSPITFSSTSTDTSSLATLASVRDLAPTDALTRQARAFASQSSTRRTRLCDRPRRAHRCRRHWACLYSRPAPPVPRRPRPQAAARRLRPCRLAAARVQAMHPLRRSHRPHQSSSRRRLPHRRLRHQRLQQRRLQRLAALPPRAQARRWASTWAGAARVAPPKGRHST